MINNVNYHGEDPIVVLEEGTLSPIDTLIIDKDTALVILTLAIKSLRVSSCCVRLNEAYDVKISLLGCILDCLSLLVIEFVRHCEDYIRHSHLEDFISS